MHKYIAKGLIDSKNVYREMGMERPASSSEFILICQQLIKSILKKYPQTDYRTIKNEFELFHNDKKLEWPEYL